MMHLTDKEKASRYDSLQVAIKHTREMYVKRRRDADKLYVDGSIISAYNKGLSDGFGYAIDDMGRWLE